MTGPYWNRGVAAHLKVAERLVLECVARGRLDLLKGVLEHTAAGSVPGSSGGAPAAGST
ncbi:hypothetical protein ACFQ60_18880 [Streptomyces zhihengii]